MIKEAYDFYLPLSGGRKNQLECVYDVLLKNLHFKRLEVIETGASHNSIDGCFGIFFAKLAILTGGTFVSVDIDPEITEKSKKMYYGIDETLALGGILHHTGDSVSFLKEYEGSPNLIHLDSWDLDVKNPVPSMLHGWLEFEAIKDKMPSGSICIIDDNFMRNTQVFWNWLNQSGEIQSTEVIDITYDILGKGSMIYHWAQKPETDWDLIGDHYGMIGESIKVIVKKR
jgi:hypothetical protein